MHERYFPDACSNYKKEASQLKPCTIDKGGQGAPARVLVIGDSHAEHFYAWFVQHSPRPVEFFTAAECPPVPRLERLQPGYHCQDYAQLAWARAVSAGVDTVIVSARWATVGLAGAPYCHQAPGAGCVVPGTLAAKQALIVSELKQAIATALAAGKTVVMVDDSPESRVRVAERLAREQFWYGQVRLTLPAAGVVAQGGWLEPVFDEFKSAPRFHRVSLRARLCDAVRCKVYDEGLKRPVFFDESHFDPLWIAQQADLFAAFVGPAR